MGDPSIDGPATPAEAQTPRERAQERAQETVEKARLTFRRLSGLDRSGPPPRQTARDQPWRPWTIPNAIGYVRLALIPVFLAFAFSSGDGQSTTGALIFAVIAWSDYADGIAARLTGQYSKLGALLDPLVDRLLVMAGVAVCWYYELLPRWALALLAARELTALYTARWGIRAGVDLRINWWGRAGVWPVMSAPFFAMVGWDVLAHVMLFIGLVLVISATVFYIRDIRRQVAARQALDASNAR